MNGLTCSQNRFQEYKNCQICQQIMSSPGALLTREQIMHLAKEHKMIYPFDENCLRGTNYNLRVGKEYYTGKRGIRDDLDKTYFIDILPFDLVAVSTYEKLKLPPFVIGRWSLKVTKTYEGIYWTGGPQVDADYEGHLYCIIYNMTSERVTLRYCEPFATIDFVVTKSEAEFQGRKNRRLGDFLTRELKSGVKDLADRIERLSRQINILFAILSIIVAVIAIFFGGAISGGRFFQGIGLLLEISLLILAVGLFAASLALVLPQIREFYEWILTKVRKKK